MEDDPYRDDDEKLTQQIKDQQFAFIRLMNKMDTQKQQRGNRGKLLSHSSS